MTDADPNSADRLRADIERLAGELDGAIAELEGSEVGAEWKLRSRLLRLEAEYLMANRPRQADPAKPLGKRILLVLWKAVSFLLDLLQRLSPVATPILIALFGILLTGTTQEFLEVRKVELAEQQLDLAAIQSLDTHIVTLRKPNIDADLANQTASRIAYFGPRAIVPLVSELRTIATTADPRATAIASALQVSALYPGQREKLCTVLGQATSGGISSVFSDAGQQIVKDVFSSVGCDG